MAFGDFLGRAIAVVQLNAILNPSGPRPMNLGIMDRLTGLS
jgi:hypothetical protein